nr:RNA-directed DNA polymerase, eukaryota, nucleotide-binding alpha-beta plait domain protein [Tanacetum cinerariifolium]
MYTLQQRDPNRVIGLALYVSKTSGKHVGVSVSNKANEESSNVVFMFISEDDCIDFDGMKRSIIAKVKDLSVITDLLKYMYSEGFVDVGLRYVGGRWVWLEFDSTDQVESVKNTKVCVLTESLHRVLESFKVSYRNRSYCITATEFPYWVSNIESTEDKSMTDSLKRKDDEGPSLDGGPEHEEPLDVDNCDSVSSKDIKDCSKNVTEKCRVVNNNMYNNVEGGILEDNFYGNRRNDTIEDNAHVNPSTNIYLDVNQNTSIPEVVEDLSSLDRSRHKAERLAHHNNGLDDSDISLRNRLLH